MAWTSNGDILYIGANGTFEPIGGKRYPGTLTANQAVTVNSSSLINTLKVGRTTDNTIISNASITLANSTVTFTVPLPTAAQVSAGDFFLGADGVWQQPEGSATSLDGMSDVTITSPANNNLLVYDNDAGQWENHTATGNSGQVNVSYASQNITVGLTPSVAIVTSVDVGANVSLTTTRLFAGNTTVNAMANSILLQVQNATNIANLTASALTLGTTLMNTSHVVVGTDVVVNSTSVAVAANVLLNTVRLHIGNTTVNATMNSINFSIDGDIDCEDLVVTGNLTVQGTMTTIDTTNLTVEDPLVKLAINNSATDTVDIGLFGLYDTSGSLDLFGGFFRDASDGKWRLFKDLQTEPTTTVNIAGTGYAVATLVAALESSSVTITGGSITGITDLAVADGGTGKSSWTLNGVVYASATGTLSDVAGTDGQVLQSVAGVPTFAMLDGGSF